MQIKSADGSCVDVATSSELHDKAGKGVAGAGLGLGIAGTALGLLNMNGCNGGLLGNLFGGNCNSGYGIQDSRVISALESKIANLTSELYANNVGIETYKQTVADNKESQAVNMSNFQKAFEGLANLDKKVAVLEATTPLYIQLAQQQANCCCQANATAISNLANTVNSVVKTVIPNTSICPGWGNVTITPATTTA